MGWRSWGISGQWVGMKPKCVRVVQTLVSVDLADLKLGVEAAGTAERAHRFPQAGNWQASDWRHAAAGIDDQANRGLNKPQIRSTTSSRLSTCLYMPQRMASVRFGSKADITTIDSFVDEHPIHGFLPGRLAGTHEHSRLQTHRQQSGPRRSRARRHG
jgi:hypothetical protein